MTSNRTVNRIGLLALALTGLVALWLVASQSATADSPSINGQTWQFDADSTGNVVGIVYTGVPTAGLGAADISVAFDSTVLAITACTVGDLDGACNPNAAGGPARAAGFKAPAITTEPVTIATLTVDCVGAAGSNSALTITVNELVDGTVGGQAISASVTNGSVTCGTATSGQTETTSSTTAGGSDLALASTDGFKVGDTIVINKGSSNEETRKIIAVGSGSITLDSALEFDHAPGEAVVSGPSVLPPTGGAEDGSSGSFLLIVMGIIAAGAIAVFGALGISRVVRRSQP